MKLLLLTLTAAAISAAPKFIHPNYGPALPAPFISSPITLDLPTLEREAPTWDVYFDGGLVGYFGRIPYAPIWTTPAGERWDLEWEVEHPILWVKWIRNHEPDCPVPEPGTLVMMTIGAGLIGWRKWRVR